MTSWFVEESDYQQTSGIEFDLMRSGYLNIQPTDPNASDAVSMPFLWWSPQQSYYYNTSYFWWWDGKQLAGVDNLVEEELNNLRYVKFELDEDPDEFYYLVVPQTETNSFIDLDGIYLELDSYDPTYEDGLFAEILNSNYEFVGVEDAQLDIADLLNWVELANQQQTTTATQTLVPNQGQSESVPEPSAVSGVLVVGAVLLAALVKRGCCNWWRDLLG